MKRSFITVFILAVTYSLSAASIRSAGIIGNSGTEEKPVIIGQMIDVKYNPAFQAQTNPVYDPECGLIYMIVNQDKLNAYTIDGRMEASYSIRKCTSGPPGTTKVLTRCGNNLYFMRRGELWTLPLNAPDGTKAVKTSFKPLHKFKRWHSGEYLGMSANAKDGKIALYLEDHLYLYDTVTGKTEEVCSESFREGMSSMLFADDGSFLIIYGNTALKLKNWKQLKDKDWPCNYIGKTNGMGSAIIHKNHIFGTTHGGTVYRFTADKLRPDPGVVYGGASGFFLGTVFVDPDVSSPTGITHVSDNVFAIGGFNTASIILLRWNRDTKKMERLRRIGSLPTVKNLALDSNGLICVGNYITNWDADCDTPMTCRIGGAYVQTAVAEFSPDQFITVGETHGPKMVLSGGALDKGRGHVWFKDPMKFLDHVGAACVKFGKNKKPRVFVLSSKGDVICCDILWVSQHGSNIQEQPKVKFNFANPVRKFTGLAALNDTTLLALGDGQVIVLNPDGDNWKEVSRWKQTFDPASRIAARDGRIVITEETKDKLSVYDNDGKLIAETNVSAPGIAAINGSRILVHETKNERIRKLMIE